MVGGSGIRNIAQKLKNVLGKGGGGREVMVCRGCESDFIVFQGYCMIRAFRHTVAGSVSVEMKRNSGYRPSGSTLPFLTFSLWARHHY